MERKLCVFCITSVYAVIVGVLVLNPVYKMASVLDDVLIEVSNVIMILSLYGYLYIYRHYDRPPKLVEAIRRGKSALLLLGA